MQSVGRVGDVKSFPVLIAVRIPVGGTTLQHAHRSFGGAFVDGQPEKPPLGADQRRGRGIALRFERSDEGASASLQPFVEQPDGVAEGVGVAAAVAAAEQCDLFAPQVAFLQVFEEAVPVVLQFAAAPGRGAEQQQVVFVRLVGRGVGHVVQVAFGHAQQSGDVLRHRFGRTGGAAVKNSGHVFPCFGSEQSNTIRRFAAIPISGGLHPAGYRLSGIGGVREKARSTDGAGALRADVRAGWATRRSVPCRSSAGSRWPARSGGSRRTRGRPRAVRGARP